MVGADRWRNPDEDLPDDFETRRAEYYEKLNKPRDAKVFTAQLQAEMRAELGALDTALPKLPWVTIGARQRGGAIKFTEPEPQPEPKNLRKLKKAIQKKWGTIPLIDILKEAALRTPMLKALAPVGTREAVDEAKLLERLLLIAYAYGTNSGIRAVAAGDHGHSEEELRYTARRYFTAPGLKGAQVAVANATFAARSEAILRRFTRTASHPVYQAMLEVGRAQKTIFVARYLRDRDLQREIQEGLNVVEGWNGANDVIFFGKSGELASNRRDQQELSILALHLLQAALVFVNTLLIQDTLAEPEWAGVLTEEDRRALTPLFWMHVRPYGEVRLNMSSRLKLSTPAPAADAA